MHLGVVTNSCALRGKKMIENQHASLSIAKQVMSKDLLSIILGTKQFDLRGYKIADR